MRRERAVGNMTDIAVIARPAILNRSRDHAGTHRVELYVAIASKHILRGVDQARPRASLPERARSFIAAVEILHVALTKRPHEPGARTLLCRRQKQMHMISHQAIRVEGAAGLYRQLGKTGQVNEVVGVVPE